MSSQLCIDCGKAKPIPKCLGELVIGTISGSDADVYWQDTATRRIIKLTPSVVYGLVTVSLTDLILKNNGEYKVWVVPEDGSINNNQAITVDTDTFDCWSFKVSEVVDDNGVQVEYASHTLESDE